jgi:hypothetical protein
MASLGGRQLGVRRTGDAGERGIAGLQVPEHALRHLVQPCRAAGTWGLPGRVEHDVLNDQLAAPGKQIDKSHRVVRPLEHVVRVDPHHRQPAPVGAQNVTLAGEFLFPDEQLTVVSSRLATAPGW